ncbi:MAG: ribonuclease HI family protein [Candidatus Melainabacteria bacterium]|nr:ribonuclease HI family protein [Candidatus Melainabacteria bacterium]
MKVSHESQQYLKDSITVNNLETIKQINKKAKQVLITNDSKENNDLFIKEAGLENCFHEVHAQTNKEQLVDFLKKDDSIFLTGNPFLVNSYLKRGIKNILTIEEIKLISFNKATDNELITINIDGASKGNPGPASIGMVFYKDKQIINEASEFIGIKTNNFAEYTALIRALEISLDKGFNNIMIKSDSELVVNQINKTYKVKDSDIKDLFDKAYSLIEKLNSFKIIHVPREENLKADKLANNALKNNLPISQ